MSPRLNLSSGVPDSELATIASYLFATSAKRGIFLVYFDPVDDDRQRCLEEVDDFWGKRVVRVKVNDSSNGFGPLDRHVVHPNGWSRLFGHVGKRFELAA